MSQHSTKSIRTPLGHARGLGAAKEGAAHWWMQRVTSVALLPLTFYFLWNAPRFLPGPENFGGLVAVLTDPVMTIALILGVLSGCYHTHLGVQVIVEDYVHAHGAKTALLLLNTLFFSALGVAALYALAVINFAPATV